MQFLFLLYDLSFPFGYFWSVTSSFTLKLQWGSRTKVWFSHIFWLGGHIDQRLTRLSCILHELFRDTPLDHIWGAQIRAQICQIWPNMPNMHIWVHIWARKIWSSGVSLKRSCKMQFRRADLASIGSPSQKLWPNVIFAWFPQCNHNTNYLRCGVTGWTCFVSIFLFSLSFLYNLANYGDSDNFLIF